MKSKCQLTDNRRHDHLESNISGDYIARYLFLEATNIDDCCLFAYVEIYILSIQLIILTKQQK